MARKSSWIGRLVGGALGLAVGGLPGLFIGIVLGFFIDKFLSRQVPDSRRREEVFFRNTFALFAKLARADERISREEIAIIEQYMRDYLRLDEAARREAIAIFRDARDSGTSFHLYAQEFYDTFRDDPAVLRHLVDMLLQLARADGQFHPGEEALIHTVAAMFGISDLELEMMKQRYFPPQEHDPLRRAYTVLGCQPGDSVEYIKRRFRTLAKEHHPDALRGRGLPPQFLEQAKEKFQEIQQAYDQIKRQRGFS